MGEVEQEVGKLKAKSTQQLQEFVDGPIPWGKSDKSRREYVRTQLVTSGNYEALWQKMLRIGESMDKNSPDLRNKQLDICVAVAAMRLLDEPSSAGKKVQVSHLVGWASTPEGWQAVGE